MILPVGFIYDFTVSYEGNNLVLSELVVYLIILPQTNK